MPVNEPTKPEGNPFSGEASIPTGNDADSPAAAPTADNAPNDDESAQQGETPDIQGPLSTGGEGVEPADYIATDGDVQGEGRSTQDLKDRRVVDPNAPFDYAELPDGPNVQGNVYPPGKDYLERQFNDAQRAYDDAINESDQKIDKAKAELDRATEALGADHGPGPVDPDTDTAVHENQNVEV